jgi:hypothetical protein
VNTPRWNQIILFCCFYLHKKNISKSERLLWYLYKPHCKCEWPGKFLWNLVWILHHWRSSQPHAFLFLTFNIIVMRHLLLDSWVTWCRVRK